MRKQPQAQKPAPAQDQQHEEVSSRHRAQPEPLWTTQEAAAYLGVSSKTVYNWRRAGLLPCFEVGRTVRFYPEVLRNFQQREQHG